jgi:hypothetical protein
LLTTLLVIVLLLPLALVPLPPILDYPNHLARMFVLANGPSDPFLSQVYAQKWDIIPNIGIDLIMPPMLTIMSVYTAGRIMLGLVLLLPVFGTIAYSRAVFRIRSPWPLASGLIAYNAVFLLGFMNFLIGIGAALLAASYWIRWRAFHPLAAVAAMAVLALGIFFVHIFGLLFLGLLIGSHELIVVWQERQRARSLPRFAAKRLAVCVPVFALPIGLYLFSPLGHSHDVVAWGTAAEKFTTLLGPFSTYAWPSDLLAAALTAGIIVGCILWRRAIVAPQAVLAAAVLMVLYPFVPTHLEAAYIDTRLPIMAAFLVFAGFAPRGLPARAAAGVTLSLCLVFLLRMAFLTYVWLGQNQDVADMRRVIAYVPPASRVLVVLARRSDNPTYWNAMPRHRFLKAALGVPPYSHLPGMLVIERRSIWPLMFTVPTKQPLIVRPAYQDITLPEGLVPHYRLLDDDEPPSEAIKDAPYLAHWTTKFDYVLIMPAGGVGDMTAFRPDRLKLVTQTDIAALLRVRPAH